MLYEAVHVLLTVIQCKSIECMKCVIMLFIKTVDMDNYIVIFVYHILVFIVIAFFNSLNYY